MISPEMWAQVEKLTYYLFFPALLLLRLSDSNWDWDDLKLITKVIAAALFVTTLLIAILRKYIASDLASLSSVYQGSVRFNTYIGLACIEALYGDRGLVAAALCLSVYIPLVNVLCVISLGIGGSAGTNRLQVIVGSVLTNPLVLACLGGIALSANGIEIPTLAASVISILSQPALPLGLLAVGAGIRFVALGQQGWQLFIAVFNKLLVFPAIVLGSCLFFELPGMLAMIILLLTALPAPPSAYILARQLGGNVSLMANIITVQTIAAFPLIPLWIEIGNRFL